MVNPCSRGHYGPLCRTCDVSGLYHNGQRFYKQTSKACDHCLDNLYLNLFYISLLFLQCLILQIYSIKASQKSILEILEIIEGYKIDNNIVKKKEKLSIKAPINLIRH